MAFASALDRRVARLVSRSAGGGSRAARTILTLLGVEVPRSVVVGKDLKLPHATTGFVIHPNTVIGDRVTIFHGVTVGRANVWEPPNPELRWGSCEIEDDVVLCAGAVVLIHDGQRTRVGQGTVLGANAVLTESTGEWEIWAGSPARKVGDRPRVAV